jgi:poly(A)-specific ribonuclease
MVGYEAGGTSEPGAPTDLGSTITRATFELAAAALAELLPTAEFVAVDCEMTGIHLAGSQPSQRDTTQERYDKMRRVATAYSLIQVGICTFHRDPSGAGGGARPLVARPFNFSVLPSMAGGPRRLLLDLSACSFLRGNRMDFNAWIDGGVPFLSEAEVEEAAAALRR